MKHNPVKIVTGFVPTPNPRPVEDYYKLGEKLCMVPVAKKVFKDYPLEECWMHRFIKELDRDLTWSQGDNPKKNTLEYHIIQHQKTDWMIRAALDDDEADVFVWIDYGIFHLPDVTVAVINKLCKRAEAEPEMSIPGCWPKGPIDDAYPCWRFCGGLLVATRELLFAFDKAVKINTMNNILNTGNITWEVNDWARAEAATPFAPIRWYEADHDKTMFTNY